MSIHFCVLGSGSAGNSALIMSQDAHVLIDAGFVPDEISARLDGTGATWETLDAVVLTHTHDDHLKKTCLKFCAQHDVEFICHQQHVPELGDGKHFKKLQERGLVRVYDGQPFDVGGQLRFFPIHVSHDAAPTFGFRVEARQATDECWVKLGYLTDLGECTDSITTQLADVDLLALEFNHDEEMQRGSGRHPVLIQRILGKHGHLSNRQAADVFRRILEHNGNGGPKLLVQMHLSRECNKPELAYAAAQEVVLMSGARTRVFSTKQDRRGTVHEV